MKGDVLWQALNEVQDVGITARRLDLLLRDFGMRFASSEKDVEFDCAGVQGLAQYSMRSALPSAKISHLPVPARPEQCVCGTRSHYTS